MHIETQQFAKTTVTLYTQSNWSLTHHHNHETNSHRWFITRTRQADVQLHLNRDDDNQATHITIDYAGRTSQSPRDVTHIIRQLEQAADVAERFNKIIWEQQQL